jgi:hypothetical protein
VSPISGDLHQLAGSIDFAGKLLKGSGDDFYLFLGFLPVSFLDGLANSRQSLDGVARVKTGRVDQVFVPGSPWQSFFSS